MKLSIGELPDDHPFILITRPFIEATFKIVGWFVVVATIQYAYEKTNSTLLLCLYGFLYILIFAYVYGLVEWISSFRRYKYISGKLLASIALEQDKPLSPKKRRIRMFFMTIRRLVVATISLILFFAIQISANIAVSKTIDAFFQFQKSAH
jgi:hypothetical protein